VLPATLANWIATPRPGLVSRPSKATAMDCIGEGSPPHTITHRSAMRMSEITVGPSAPPLVSSPGAPRARIRGLGELSELDVGIARQARRLDVQPAASSPLARPVEHGGPSASCPCGSRT